MQLGVAYYPDYIYPTSHGRGTQAAEASVEEQIVADIERMHRLGLKIIRMGEFSWGHVEPRPGELQFRRFIFALDRAKEAGIQAVLCTPTATPPKWFVDQHPETLPVDRQGRTIPFGGRRHYDPASESFRAASRRITKLYAEALGKHAAVIGWQTDNEIGNHSSWQSFTPSARNQFRDWLRRRYHDDIQSLNEAWFTCFWSMQFRDFDEIELPHATWTAPNPHLELDFRRFMTSVNRDFQREQIDIIRQYSPGRFVTHNITPMLFELDLWSFCADLDVVGYDHYQMGVNPDPVSTSSQFALMRSLRQGRPFMVLEQQPLQVNWQRVNRRFAMDWLLLWGAQAAFQGADAMLYFSWRRFKGGSEQFHDAIVPHDARIKESRQEKVIRAKLSLFDTIQRQFQLTELPKPTPRVLIIHDGESIWAHETPNQSQDFQIVQAIESIQRLLLSRGYSMAMAPSLVAAELSGYELVMLPAHAFALSATEREALKSYVEAGGRVLSLPRTGLKDRYGRMVEFPTEFYGREEFYLDDYGALLDHEVERMQPVNVASEAFCGRLWAEKIVIPPTSPWKPLAFFDGGLYAGAAAAMMRELGQGRHLHLAAWPEISEAAATFVERTLDLTPDWQVDTSGDIQIFPLKMGSRKFIGVINFSDHDAAIKSRRSQGVQLAGLIAHLEPDLRLQKTTHTMAVTSGDTWQVGARTVSIWESLA